MTAIAGLVPCKSTDLDSTGNTRDERLACNSTPGLGDSPCLPRHDSARPGRTVGRLAEGQVPWSCVGFDGLERSLLDAPSAEAEAALSHGRLTAEDMAAARKLCLYLRGKGHDVARCTIDRLMREMGIHGVRRGRFPVTTVADPAALRPEDRVHDLVFCTSGGRPVNKSQMSPIWVRARAKVGRDDLRFHDLRHTGQTLAALAGATEAELMQSMGHSTTSANRCRKPVAVSRRRRPDTSDR